MTEPPGLLSSTFIYDKERGDLALHSDVAEIVEESLQRSQPIGVVQPGDSVDGVALDVTHQVGNSVTNPTAARKLARTVTARILNAQDKYEMQYAGTS